MKRFFTFLKTELKLSVRDMNMVIFAVIMPFMIFIILGIIYGAKPACDGADYTFLEQSFGAVSAVAICASGLMGLPLAVSGLREMKVLKRMRVTPVSPIFILGVELAMYAVYCAVSLATLSICVMLGVAALSTTLAVRFFPLRIRCQYLSGGIAFFNEAAASSAAKSPGNSKRVDRVCFCT